MIKIILEQKNAMKLKITQFRKVKIQNLLHIKLIIVILINNK